jgi:hypothetical protein
MLQGGGRLPTCAATCAACWALSRPMAARLRLGLGMLGPRAAAAWQGAALFVSCLPPYTATWDSPCIYLLAVVIEH